jgi:hypothetical protein
MTLRDRRVLLAGLAIAIAASGLAMSQQPKTTALFDGKTLDGWKKAGFANEGDVHVEDGSIVMPAGRPMSGVTSTRTDLPTTDYELTFEARRLDGNDFFAACTFPVGKSFITLINGGWGGTITGLSSLDGADASENQSGKYVKYEDKTWYRFRVRVTDKAIRCSVNDEEVVAVDIEDREVGTRIETRRNQPLGFSTYRSTGEVRKVEVRKLTPVEVSATNKIENK